VELPRHKNYSGQTQSIIYGYRADGSLGIRDWSRTDGANRLRTTWLYSNAGKLTATHYGSTAIQTFAPSHALHTPSVTYTYDLAGRVSTRTDGTGTTSLSWRFDGSPLTEDGAAAGRHLRRAYDASGRLLRLESSWGTQLGAVSATGSDQVSPAITYTYASADRLSSIASGGMTGTITRTSSQEALTVNFTGLYYSPHSTYNRILRNSYGQLQSHLASYTQYNFTSPTTFTIRDNTFTWDSNRLATRGEGDTTWNYTYDAITRPQSFDVTGKRTSTSATITVNGVSLPTSGYQPNDNGLHFRKEVANTPAASLNGDIYAALPGDIFEPVTVSQTINGTTTDLTNDLTNAPPTTPFSSSRPASPPPRPATTSMAICSVTGGGRTLGTAKTDW
jgi:hypothetical protein